MAQGTQDALPDLAKLEIKNGEKLLKCDTSIEIHRLNVIIVENSQFWGCGKAQRTTIPNKSCSKTLNSTPRKEFQTLSSGTILTKITIGGEPTTGKLIWKQSQSRGRRWLCFQWIRKIRNKYEQINLAIPPPFLDGILLPMALHFLHACLFQVSFLRSRLVIFILQHVAHFSDFAEAFGWQPCQAIGKAFTCNFSKAKIVKCESFLGIAGIGAWWWP